MERWQAAFAAIEEFRSYLAASVPPIQILRAHEEGWTREEYKRKRPDGFPSRLRGVYLIFDHHQRLVWVGKAMWNFDKRVWSHDSEVDRHYVDVIPFDEEHCFLAPALEFFLICKLAPPGNKEYRELCRAIVSGFWNALSGKFGPPHQYLKKNRA